MAQDLIIRIGAKSDQLKTEFKNIRKQTQSLEDGLNKIARTSAIAFAGLSAGIGGATKVFATFESQFSDVVTLLDKSSFSTKTFEKGVADLEKEILLLGATSGKSFTELNKGLFDLISAGVPAEKAMSTLAVATELATAGATTTDVAVKAMTASLTSFGDEAGDATDIAEKFFTAQKFGLTTVGELANEFNKVAGTANALGLSFEETLAAATSLTANGAKPTAEAFTELKGLMTAVILAQGKLNGQSKEVQRSLSLENIQRVGIVKAIQQTNDAIGGNIVQLQKLLGSETAVSAALALTGSQAKTFSKIFKEMNDETKRAITFQAGLEVKQKTTTEAMKRLSGSVRAASIEIGAAFAPTVNDLADVLLKAVTAFQELDDETVQTIADFTIFATATAGVIAILAIFAKALLIIRAGFLAVRTAAIVMWASALGPIAAVIAAFVGVQFAVKALADNFVDAEGIVGKFARGFIARFEAMSKAIGGAISKALEFLGLADEEISPAVDANGAPLKKGEAGKVETPDATEDARVKREREIQEAIQAIKDEFQALEDEKKIARQALLAEENALKVENEIATDEEKIKRNEDLENLLTQARKKGIFQRLKLVKDGNKKELTEEEKLKKAQEALDERRKSAISALKEFAISQGGAAAKALFLINKASALGDAINNTAVAITAAMRVPPPLGQVLATRAKILGGIQIAAIAASTVAGFSGAQKGGIVGGSGIGDTQPFLLEPGELIVPKPLVPNFIQSIGAAGGDLDGENGGQTVKVEIDITDEASQIITVRQREDTVLGIT